MRDSKDFIVANIFLNTGVKSEMSNFENILRSIPGYILDPAGTYEKKRNTNSYRSIVILLILDAIVALLSGLSFIIYEIFSGYSTGPQLLLPTMVLHILVNFIIIILVIVAIIHFASRYENRDVKFVDSFKISIVSYTYYIVVIAIFNLIKVLYTAGTGYNPGSQIYFADYLALILALLVFIRVSAEGIKTLHGLSGLKSYVIAIISIAAAKIIVYLASSPIGDFCLFVGL
ncbi:YIP1 family protein [Methanolacinia paynteri]|uniref:YIP1 family protein n=1 Tax=Methanolacinia paynteri TaxID=230356 RepID=UPI00064E6218|nr:YIP1 family protein [Methanolacinia paynteri]